VHYSQALGSNKSSFKTRIRPTGNSTRHNIPLGTAGARARGSSVEMIRSISFRLEGTSRKYPTQPFGRSYSAENLLQIQRISALFSFLSPSLSSTRCACRSGKYIVGTAGQRFITSSTHSRTGRSSGKVCRTRSPGTAVELRFPVRFRGGARCRAARQTDYGIRGTGREVSKARAEGRSNNQRGLDVHSRRSWGRFALTFRETLSRVTQGE
jgi:hypothetical protein